MDAVIRYILDLGAAVFLPIVMIIIALIVKMKPQKAIICGITLGIAFTGMNVVLGFMFNSISPAAAAFVRSTGINLTTIDVGWSPVAAIAWAWPYALMVFPIQIAINVIMIALGWTNCLNVDMWNVWGKILTALMVTALTDSVALGLVAAGVEVVFELKNGDFMQKSIHKLSKLPDVTCAHVMNLEGVILAPINRMLDFVPILNKINVDSNKLKEKIGIFGENSVMGFIVGGAIAAFGGYDMKGILTTAVQVATALVLFPLVANLFMDSLGPIAQAAGDFMKEKYNGREFFIGVDWPILAGRSELWVASILLIPFELLFAVLLAKVGISSVLPLASIINIGFVVSSLIITGGNLVRMLIMGIITTPIYLIVSSQFAPIFTKYAQIQNTLTVPDGQLLTYFGIEGPEFRWAIAHAANIIHGDVIGLGLFSAFIALFVWYGKYMRERNN
ncbi:PTS system galactitol-specific IIC component [Sporomusaceae bacterium BoRhaA]|uniref:PTS galactitol transporter subunit IIC n=1 Tax=Pelorhabdus rhamnosifermentans TaxID=2772457 RepID=UPI001C061502|nr:PTS transporter subunit IIC [Pelorhabdus rhamnosifermentans]MBU2699270.1 PTS system galactitol-specific IIC component [Pelorhabdus rhamnosifermentans]